MREGGREPAGGVGPGPVVQWRLPLTGSVSYRPGRHGRASQTAAVLECLFRSFNHASWPGVSVEDVLHFSLAATCTSSEWAGLLLRGGGASPPRPVTVPSLLLLCSVSSSSSSLPLLWVMVRPAALWVISCGICVQCVGAGSGSLELVIPRDPEWSGAGRIWLELVQ